MRLITKLKTYLKDQCGAAAVEFALVAPIFVYMLVGTVDYGFYITESMQLKSTAHAVADYVSQVQDNANADVIAEETYGARYDQVSLNTEFTCQCSDGVAQACPIDCGSDDYQRRFVDVTASGTFDPIFAYPGLPDDMALQSTVRMRVD